MPRFPTDMPCGCWKQRGENRLSWNRPSFYMMWAGCKYARTDPDGLWGSSRGEEAERLNRIHEQEGAAIARRVLQSLNYNPQWIERIAFLIERHDSGDQPDSLEEKLLKDADKLWRFSPFGFWNEIERQGLDQNELYQFLLARYRGWFFTKTAVKLAEGELSSREKEISSPVP